MSDPDAVLARQIALKAGHVEGLDEDIGSFLEAWLTRETGGMCSFCGTIPNDAIREGVHRFCTTSCKDSFLLVFKVRLLIGVRDLARRGFD